MGDMQTSSQQLSISRCRRVGLYVYSLAVALVCPVCIFTAEAQPKTFIAAAKQIVDEVAVGGFGAMVVAITGILAIVSAVTGSYKGAWAVAYVSVGLYILKELVRLLFPAIGT